MLKVIVGHGTNIYKYIYIYIYIYAHKWSNIVFVLDEHIKILVMSIRLGTNLIN